MTTTTEPVAAEAGRDFIRDIITADLSSGKYREIVTRFPPEPNGYLHIGHAKSIALNFGIAQEFPGHCNLRFDDTNPAKEEQEYIDSIQADVSWLGYKWAGEPLYASDYFERLYEWAEGLIMFLDHVTPSGEPVEDTNQPNLSRRAFLRAGAAAGGGLLLSINLPLPTEAATDADAFAPNAFIRIAPDGQIAFIMPQIEMGQGTYTSMSMLIAEELEVGLDQ